MSREVAGALGERRGAVPVCVARRVALDLASALEVPLLFLVDTSGNAQELQWQLALPTPEKVPPIGIVAVPSLTRVLLATVLRHLVEQRGYLDPAIQAGGITTPEQQALCARFRDDFDVALTPQAAYQLRQRLALAVKHPPKQLRRITLETLAAHRSEQI